MLIAIGLDRSPEQASHQFIMDEYQSPNSNKKRKSAVALPGQKRCLLKKTKIAGDLAGTCMWYHYPVPYHQFTFQSSAQSKP